MTDLTVGNFYDVPCAEILMSDGRNYFIPVFDLLHTDKQFGFPHEHYHIDGRFHVHPRMHHEFSLHAGHTSAVIVPNGQGYKFVGIVTKNVKCERLQTGIVIPQQPTEKQRPKVDLYEKWYQGYVGITCHGRRCPHLGTEMLEKNGKLVCPLHNLTADLQTLKVSDKN